MRRLSSASSHAGRPAFALAGGVGVSTLELRIVVDGEGRVVREALRFVDARTLRFRGDPGRRDLVVDAPADVLRPGLAAVRPPGVLPRPRVDAAEHVHPAGVVEGRGEPGALLGQEPRVLAVAAPVLEVDLLVRDVPVAAEHELAPARLEPSERRSELLEKAELRLLPFLGARARGQVDRYHRQPAEIGAQEPAFGVELAAAEAARDAVGFHAGIQRHAAVAPLGRAAFIVPVPALRDEREAVEIRFLRLDLLQADDICALARKPPRETL